MSTENATAHAVDPNHGSHGTMKIEKVICIWSAWRTLLIDGVQTEKRDALQVIEKKYQKLWQDERVFESDAPSNQEYPFDSISPEELRAKVPKYFCIFSNQSSFIFC